MQRIVSVYGLGYVGLTLCAAWHRAGYGVLGVDVTDAKVRALNNGLATHIEPGVRKEVAKAVSEGRLEATSDGVYASEHSDIKLISVPVGLDDRGRPVLKSLEQVADEMSQGLKIGDVVVLESSVPIGTTLNLVRPLLEEISGLEAERDFYLAYSPERISIGRALEDLEERYPKVVGGVGPRSSEKVGRLYSKIARKGVRIVSSPTVAEFEKLAEGVYRDVNIALANELATLAAMIGLDYGEIAGVANSQPFCHLHQPGIGVGGACIPVYPRFLLDVARKAGVDMKLTTAARGINLLMPYHIAERVLQLASKIGLDSPDIAVLGLAYRGGIDDTRLSPTYDLINVLLKSGVNNIVVNDPYVSEDALLQELGIELTKSLENALNGADVAVMATDHPEYRGLDLATLRKIMNKRQVGIVDGRHLIEDWRNPPRGVAYVGVGRPFVSNL